MLIAVAGASGRMGARFLLYCMQKGMPALALVRSEAKAEGIPQGIAHAVVDYSDGAGLAKALEGATHIVNLTGSTDTSLGKDALLEANISPTKALLEAAPPSLERFVHLSSISVYGKGGVQSPLDENSPKNPSDAYGISKLEGEKLALSYSGKFSVVALEPAVIYGPGFKEGFYPVLRYIKGGKMRIIGSGSNHFPLVHADDVASALAKALFASVQSGSTYLISNDPSPTQSELMEIAAGALGVQPPDKKINYNIARALAAALALASKLGAKKPSLTPEMADQLYFDRQFCCKKAKAELGWAPSIDFKNGIGQVVSEFMRETKPE